MRGASKLASLGLLITITGCGAVPQRYQLAAEPLMDVPAAQTVLMKPNPLGPPTPVLVDLQPIDRINLLVQDSQSKCSHFVDSMFAETAGSGFLLDVLSTGTSAVSAIVTPLSTAHALGATSTILGATKTGISANYLNTLSISHITQAIQSTYTADIKNYVNSLAALPPIQQASLNPFMERSKIESYHAECSLAAAEGSINTTLKSSNQSGGQSLSPLIYTVTGNGDTSAVGIATALSIAINGYPAFQQAGITALPLGSAMIGLGMTSPLNFSMTSSDANFKAAIIQGTPATAAQAKISVTGTLRKNDTVTVTAAPVSATPQQSGASGATAPAAASAQPTIQH